MNRKAIIYRPSKSAMQSGVQNMNQWKVDIRSDDRKFVDPTMGWIGGSDTTRQLTLSFATQEEAIAYCEKNGLPWSIMQSKTRKAKPKSYANNFATHKRRYSDVAVNRKIDL